MLGGLEATKQRCAPAGFGGNRSITDSSSSDDGDSYTSSSSSLSSGSSYEDSVQSSFVPFSHRENLFNHEDSRSHTRQETFETARTSSSARKINLSPEDEAHEALSKLPTYDLVLETFERVKFPIDKLRKEIEFQRIHGGTEINFPTGPTNRTSGTNRTTDEFEYGNRTTDENEYNNRGEPYAGIDALAMEVAGNSVFRDVPNDGAGGPVTKAKEPSQATDTHPIRGSAGTAETAKHGAHKRSSTVGDPISIEAPPVSPSSRTKQKSSSRKHKKNRSAPAMGTDAATANESDAGKVERIKHLVQKYEPAKEKQLNKLLLKYKGTEDVLIAKLLKRYEEKGDGKGEEGDTARKKERKAEKKAKKKKKEETENAAVVVKPGDTAALVTGAAAAKTTTTTTTTTTTAATESERASEANVPSDAPTASDAPLVPAPPGATSGKISEISLLLESAYGVLSTPEASDKRLSDVLAAYNDDHEFILTILRDKVKED